jgi:hypothetical protein
MTLDYYLFRDDTTAVFELGSGGWGNAWLNHTTRPDLESPIIYFPPPDDWRPIIYVALGRFSELDPAYLVELARRLSAFAHGAPLLWCTCDAGDRDADAFRRGYRVTGSRYAKRVGDWWLEMVSTPPVEQPRRDDYELRAWTNNELVNWQFTSSDAAYEAWHTLTVEDIEGGRGGGTRGPCSRLVPEPP